MEVARTSMIHAAAPHFLWPFAVRYAAHQLNLWPRVSLPETSPTLLWTGTVGDASRFRVWGARAFVRDTTADKLSPRAIPCVFLGFVPDAPGWHPSPFTASSPTALLLAPPPPPLFLAPGPPQVDPLPEPGPAPSGVSQVDPPAPVPVEVTGDSGLAASGAVPGGAEPGGAASGGAASGGAEPACAEPRGAESGGESPEGSATAFPRSPWSSHLRPRVPLTSQQLHDWYGRRQRRASAPQGSTAGGSSAGVAGPGGARTEGTGAAGAGGVVTECTGAAEGAGAAGGTGGAGGAGAAEGTGATSGAGAAEGTGAAGGAGPAKGPGATGGAGGAGAAGAGGTAQQHLFFAPPSPLSQPPPDSALRQVLSLPSSTGLPLQPGSPLPAPSPYTEKTRGLAECREPASRPVSSVHSGRSGRRVPRQQQPAVSGSHLVARRPSSPLLRVPLPSPSASSLPVVADPASDQFCAEHSTLMRLLATVVTDPSFESTAASALVAELIDFAAACRLDYADSLVAESESVCPPFVRGECALGTDVLEDKQEDLECLAAAAPHLVSMLLAPEVDLDAPDIPTPHSYAEAIAGEYSSQWQTAMDAKMASSKSTSTYVDEVPPPGANIVSGMWIFRVKRTPGSPPVFKARYVARGFSQREGVDFFQTFSPTPKMTTLRVLLHVAAQRDYELHSLDFSTAFLQGSLHEEIWLCRPPGFTGSFPPGTHWSLRRPVYGLRQAPREWHDTLRTTLATLGFAPSSADLSLFLRTDTSLPPFYILVYVDDLVFATADTEALALVKSELQKRHTCTDLGELRSYLGLQITRDRARRTITLTQSHMVQQVLQRFGFTWSSAQATPQATSHSLSAPPSDESVERSGPYPELVGCLMYQMTCTRPDLAYPLGLLARYVAPGRHRKVHMDAAKRVLSYLCSTSGMGLVLGGRGDVVLVKLICYSLYRAGEQCGGPHSTQRCFGRLTDAWRHQFPDATEIPRWGDLSRAGVAVFDLDYDAILAAMYALSTSDEGDCYLCVPPDPGIEAAALGAGETAALGASASAAPGAGESAPSGTASAQVFHTFILDSGASRSFFRDCTTLTPLSRPVAVSLADPSGGPVLASFSTVLPCLAAPSGSLSGLYLPSFPTNLVSGADLQDQGVDQFTPASQRVTYCTCARTGRHLATFTRRPGSSLYTLSTESPPVSASGQVAASSQMLAAASGSGMASRVLVSGLPRSLPPLPPGPAPTCVPCVEGRQRAAPHSSEFPPTEAPLQTLHMDMWGPARVRGQGHERYFLLVVDDYLRYTTVFPLRGKGEVAEVLIDWIRAARLRLRESFGSDFPVLRLHSDRGGEFSSALLGAFCRAQGIHQTFTLPASPQQNGIAERRIGM
ncbi:unnamed protein product, partial [Closterium sp. NIES-53]